MMKLKYGVLAGGVLAVAPQANAASVIALIADEINSDPARIAAPGGGVNAVLSDGFAYDIENPTLTTPALGYSEDGTAMTANGWHALNGGITSPSFFLDLAEDYTIGSGDVLVLDAWGRNRRQNVARDDDYTVTLFDPTGAIIVAAAGEGIFETFYNRTEFSGLADGTVVDRIQVQGMVDGSFTIQEVRFGVVPEPSSILLTGLAALGFIGRRRR